MASKFVMLCLSIALFAILTPSLAAFVPGGPPPPSKNVRKRDIANICSKTLDRQNCLATIAAIPEWNRTNLLGLTNAVIAAGNTSSTNGYNAIQSMIASTEEPELKYAFTLCAQHYYNAREEFYSCNFCLSSPAFYIENVHVLVDLPRNAILEIKACEIDLQQAQQKGSPVTPLTNTNNKMIIASDLVAVVGTYLYESFKKAGY